MKRTKKGVFPMSKKTVKLIVTITGVAAFIAAIVYFINHKKAKNAAVEEEEFEPDEEHLDAADALDLSSLKFSRHYVDLR